MLDFISKQEGSIHSVCAGNGKTSVCIGMDVRGQKTNLVDSFESIKCISLGTKKIKL